MGGGAEKKEKRKDKPGYLVVKAGQAGAELRSVGLAGDGNNHHQAKFNITVPIPGKETKKEAETGFITKLKFWI